MKTVFISSTQYLTVWRLVIYQGKVLKVAKYGNKKLSAKYLTRQYSYLANLFRIVWLSHGLVKDYVVIHAFISVLF